MAVQNVISIPLIVVDISLKTTKVEKVVEKPQEIPKISRLHLCGNHEYVYKFCVVEMLPFGANW